MRNSQLNPCSTIIMAGHETTSNSLSWALLELAKHPEIQSKLRDEIRAMEPLILSRGGSFTATDFDNMPYLTAVVKVGNCAALRTVNSHSVNSGEPSVSSSFIQCFQSI